MNKIIKKVILLVVAFCLVFSVMNTVHASVLSNMSSDASTFLSKGASSTSIAWGDVTGEFAGLGQALTLIGAGVLVAVTAYMGIKYLTSGPEAQAKLKVQLVGIVVSAIVIFGAYNIWKLVINIVKTF